MISVLSGLGTIAAVVLVGVVLAHLRVLDAGGQQVLARITFTVATPALILTLMSRTDISRIVSPSLAVAACASVLVALVWVGLARLRWRRSGTETVVGAWAAGYVNANNLGLPVAAFVLGDASAALPVLLLQMLLLQPLGLVVLDVCAARELGDTVSSWSVLSRPFRNPMTVATLAGVALSLLEWPLPALVAAPLDMLGAMSVPAMLVAFGVSLRLGPLPGRGEPPAQVATLVGLKLVVMPAVAWVLAALVWRLDPPTVAAVVLMAGLPSAQNVFVIATRYRVGVLLARDVVFVSTVLSFLTVVLLALLLRLG